MKATFKISSKRIIYLSRVFHDTVGRVCPLVIVASCYKFCPAYLHPVAKDYPAIKYPAVACPHANKAWSPKTLYARLCILQQSSM